MQKRGKHKGAKRLGPFWKFRRREEGRQNGESLKGGGGGGGGWGGGSLFAKR